MSDVDGSGFAPDGYDEMTSHVMASVSEVDDEVRAKLTGQSVSDIATQAETAFATIGVQLTGEQLVAYADAVSTGSAYAIDLVADA